MAQRRNGFERSGADVAVLGLGAALFVSACLMYAALRSPAGHWLGWFTLIPLFLCIRVLRPLGAFAAGCFWGVSLFACLVGSGGAPFPVGLSALLLLGLVPGAYACLGSVLTRKVGFSPLLLGLGWVAVELALQPLALRNGLLAGTQGHGVVVRTMGYLAGYVVVAFIVAYVNAMLLTMLRDVCVVILRPRPALVRMGGVNRIVYQDLPAHFSELLRPSRPRAPPLVRSRLSS